MARLRRLAPDAMLFRRRAADEPLRQLAADYGVTHSTLSRYFARPQARRQLEEAAQLNEAECRAAQARWEAEQHGRGGDRSRPQPADRRRRSKQAPAVDGDADAATSASMRAADRSDRSSVATDARVHLYDADGNWVASTNQNRLEQTIAIHQPRRGPLTLSPSKQPPNQRKPPR
jgi:DNA-binding transcriptional MocR family regulator